MLTTEQIKSRKKTVTRRLGWAFLTPGDVLTACVKCMGLKKGEKIEKLCQIQIVSIRRELLKDITQEDVIKEGFPEMNRVQFIAFFRKHMQKSMTASWMEQEVNRIEFEYI